MDRRLIASRVLLADSGVKLVLAVVILLLVGAMGLRTWQRAHRRTPLLQAQIQVATVFEDATARLRVSDATHPTSEVKVKQAQVVFSWRGRELTEYVDSGTGWQQVAPARNTSLTLPEGIEIFSWTFPTNAMRVWVNGSGTISAWDGILTLRSRNGATAEVWVGRTGVVWY
jgi:type II secretory pathway pseudopilin PulG